jgi:hypothetical protein
VRARCVVTAKIVVVLAVAAAGGWWSSAAVFYWLGRTLGAYWDGPELRHRARTTDPAAVVVVRWFNRVEVATAVAIVTARSVLAHYIGVSDAAEVTVLAVAGVLAVPPSRAVVRARLVKARGRRRWERTLAAVIPPPATPAVADIGSGPGGEWVRVRIGPGSTVKDLAGRADALAAALAVSRVTVDPHPVNAGWATLAALVADPLAVPAPPWPWLDVPATSVWAPVPVGVDETGRPVTVTLAEHNLLLGGEPGAGKSVALSQLVAAAALDVHAGLWLLDGKLVELAAWRNAATGWAGTDIVDAIGVLRLVGAIMDDRYRQLLDAGERKIGFGAALQVVVIDELAHYLTWGDKKQRDVFTDLLRDLVSRGRAAGVVVIAATQKPSSDVVPTSLRDLFGYRWALRCTTNAASDTVLGSGWASEGMSAATVAPDARGVGWLLHESGLPVRIRAHHLDDTAVRALAERAATLRREVNGDG